MKHPPLTRRQQRFVEQLLTDPKMVATTAAEAAGYSKKTSHQIAHRLMKDPRIRAAIQQSMDRRSKRTEITADRVLRELALLGFSDLRKLFTEAGQLVNITDLPDEVAASVASVEVITRPGGVNEDGHREVEYVHKIRLWDKKGALELLGKHLKLFTERIHHTGQVEFTRIERRIVDPAAPKPGRKIQKKSKR